MRYSVVIPAINRLEAGITALFGLSNRMTNVASMRVNDKSCRMWRIAGHGKEMKV